MTSDLNDYITIDIADTKPHQFIAAFEEKKMLCNSTRLCDYLPTPFPQSDMHKIYGDHCNGWWCNWGYDWIWCCYLRFIQFLITLLVMVDSSIGGKTATEPLMEIT